MVAEHRSFHTLHAMSFPAAASAAAAAGAGAYGAWTGDPQGANGTPPGSPRAARGGAHFMAAGADAAALRAWRLEVDGRLDAQSTSITGVGLTLEATINHAKAAMTSIVQGVRV